MSANANDELDHVLENLASGNAEEWGANEMDTSANNNTSGWGNPLSKSPNGRTDDLKQEDSKTFQMDVESDRKEYNDNRKDEGTGSGGNNRVFVSNLAYETTWQSLKEFMGQSRDF